MPYPNAPQSSRKSKPHLSPYLFKPIWILTALILLSGSQATASTDSWEAPNILFIYTDDQAHWAFGHSGNEQAHTPNMDRMADEGMVFPNAYTTTPVCSPSRAGLMTSRYGYEIGIDDWINIQAKSLSGNDPKNGLPRKYETWPEILQKAGYRTGLVGKWHLGFLEEHHPTKHGYHSFVGFKTGNAKNAGPQNPTLEKDGILKRYHGLTVDILTNEALEFIEKNKHRPFALSLHYRAPHAWWLPVTPEDAAPYSNREIELPNPEYPNLDTARSKKLMREYLSSVSGIDRNLGLIMERLEELDLSDSILVVFTSDHGYNIGQNGIWHKGNGFWLTTDKRESTANIPSNQRPYMYENSLKVPTIVRWPGVVAGGTTNRSTLSNLDWFPTLVRIAKSKASEDTVLREKDILPALFDEDLTLSTDAYAAYSTKHQTITHMRSYSDGEYKLVRDFANEGRDEFYDLRNDPGEMLNLIDNPEYKAPVDHMSSIILRRMHETNDPVLQQSPNRK